MLERDIENMKKKTIKFSTAIVAALMAIAPVSGSFITHSNVVQASYSRRLTHNANVYNAKGKRTRKVLKKGASVRILGKKGSFYRIGKNAYVKMANFNKKKASQRATPVKTQKISNPAANQEFISLLNNYRRAHGRRALTRHCGWLNRGSKTRFHEFVNTFKKKGRIDYHVRPNGKKALSVFGKRSIRATENEGQYMNSDPVSQQVAVKYLFNQFMYHDGGSHWIHRYNLTNRRARYVSAHFAQIKKSDGYYYIIIVHTGR